MRRILFIAFCLLMTSMAAAQNITQKGVTYRYNGKNPRTPIGKVYIKAVTSPNGVVSDSVTGVFSIQLKNLQMGSRIGNVQVTKKGMMIFNQHAVDEWSVRKEPLCLILCDANEFEKQKQNLIDIGKREAEKKYEKQIAELEREYKQKNEEYFKRLNDVEEELQNARKHMDEYADVFARVDESEVDTLAQAAIELFKKGEVEKAILLFEQGDYLEKLKQADQTIDNANALIDVAEEARTKAMARREECIQSLRAQINAYKLQNNYEKMGKLLKGLADELNTIGDIWDYASFCEGERMYEESLLYFQKLMELHKQRTDTATYNYKWEECRICSGLTAVYNGLRRTEQYGEICLYAYNFSKDWFHDSRTIGAASEYAGAMRNMGVYYELTENLENALSISLESLDLYEGLESQCPNDYQIEIASMYNNVGILLHKLGRYEESEKHLMEAIKIFRTLSEQDYKKYAAYLSYPLTDMGNLFCTTGRYKESEPFLEESAKIRYSWALKHALHAEPLLAYTIGRLTDVYKKTDDTEKLDSLYETMIQFYKLLVQSNPQIYEGKFAKSILDRVTYNIDLRRHNKSGELYREAKDALELYLQLAKCDNFTSEQHVANIRYAIGLLMWDMERYADAILSFEEALRIYWRLAADNPALQEWYLNSLYCLGRLYPATNNYTRAYQITQELLPLMKEEYGEDEETLRSGYAEALGNQSFNAIFMKNFSEAEQLAHEGLSIDSTKKLIYTNLAASLLLQGKYAEAEPIYRQYKAELKDGFLDDFQQFEKAGVIPEERKKDVERIKRMLEE